MADWTFTTGNALTRKAYAKQWFMETKTESYFYENGFVGKGFDNIIVEFPDLEKDQGDTLTIGMLYELSGAGRANDDMMESYEEAPSTYDDSITLAQIRNAVRTAGRESEQRPSDNGLREYAKELLRRWMAAYFDQTIFTDLSTSCTKIVYGGDATSTATIEAGDYMTLAVGAKCKAAARKANPMIAGPSYKGKSLNGVIVMHTDQESDLTTYDSSWNQAVKDAKNRGDDNPLFTAAVGIHRNIVYHEHPRVAVASASWGSGSTLNGATALFLGVQAGSIAYAKRKIWEEKSFDYSNKVGFCIGAIWGFTKNVFNSLDNAVIGINTYRSNN